MKTRCVAFAPSADGQACMVTPKGRTPISDGLGTWEVQVRAGPLMVGRATLIIATEGATVYHNYRVTRH